MAHGGTGPHEPTARGRLAVLAWFAAGLAIALALGAAVLAVVRGEPSQALYVLLVSAYAIVGAVVATTRPRNPVGWLFAALALTVGELVLAQGYARMALPRGLPGADLAAWLGIWPIEAVTGLLVLGLVLFPHGAPPSPRWRPLIGLIAAETFLQTLLSFGWNVNVGSPGNFPEAVFPFHLPGLVIAHALYGALQMVSLLWFGAAVAAMVHRYRVADVVERRQVTWVAYAVSLLGVAMLVNTSLVTSGEASPLVFALMSPLVPVAAGLAILRHRLYDIDVIVRRTLLYGVLTACLAAFYFGLVVVLQELLRALTGQRSDVAVVASTLASAALFAPLRRHLQRLLDRLFYRSRGAAEEVLRDVGRAVRVEVDVDRLTGAVLAAVDGAMRPEHVSLWVREERDRRA